MPCRGRPILESPVVWTGDTVIQNIKADIGARVQQAGGFVQIFIHGALGRNVGSVVPFVASQPGEYPYQWDGVLQDSITYSPGNDPLEAFVYSDAVDQHVHPGQHFSAAEEFGSWWDGWAWDFETGRIVKVAEEHMVEGRHFMSMGLNDCREAVYKIIAGKGIES